MAHDIDDWRNKKETVQRTAEYNGQMYLVEYDYYPGRSGMVPATNPPGRMHYGATVRVYRVVGDDRTRIGIEMDGWYIEGGCFEDKPSIYIERAIGLQIKDRE